MFREPPNNRRIPGMNSKAESKYFEYVIGIVTEGILSQASELNHRRIMWKLDDWEQKS